MSFATQICLTRPELEQTMFKLIERNIIKDIRFQDVLQMSWIKMFYTALKYSKGYSDLIDGQIQPLDLSRLEFNEMFTRVQTLIEYFYERPPITIHSDLLRRLTLMANFYGSFTPITDVEIHIELNRTLFEYLESIAKLINGITLSDETVQAFLLDEDKFYPSESSIQYITIETESIERINYVQTMNEFVNTIKRVNLLPQVLGYIFRNEPNVSAIFIYKNISIPVVGNFLPPSLQRLLTSDDSSQFIENHFLDHSIINEKSRLHGNRGEIVNLFDDLITAHEFLHLDEGIDELSESSSSFEDAPDFLSLLTSTTKSGPSDEFLIFRIRHELDIIKEMNQIPEHFLHVIRFNTDVEKPVLVFKRDVKETDLRVFRGETELHGFMIVTFTVATRNPIFNPVI